MILGSKTRRRRPRSGSRRGESSLMRDRISAGDSFNCTNNASSKSYEIAPREAVRLSFSLPATDMIEKALQTEAAFCSGVCLVKKSRDMTLARDTAQLP